VNFQYNTTTDVRYCFSLLRQLVRLDSRSSQDAVSMPTASSCRHFCSAAEVVHDFGSCQLVSLS